MGGKTKKRLGFEVIEDCDSWLAVMSGKRICSNLLNVRVLLEPMLDPLLKVFTLERFNLHPVEDIIHSTLLLMVLWPTILTQMKERRI